MKFFSTIIALLLIPMIGIAQSGTGNYAQDIAKLGSGKAATENLLTGGNSGEPYSSPSLVFTTERRINSAKVIDESGEVVMATSSSGEGARFNLNKLRKGLYYIQIYCDGENIVRKFLKK